MEEIGLDDDGSIDDEFVTYGLNEADEYAVEEAVQLAEEHGGEVTVVTIGDSGCEETIRTCIAKGADNAVRIWDDVLEGSDSPSKATVLASVVEDLDGDLVFTGLQSDDTANNQVGGTLARELDLPYTSLVVDLDYAPGEDTATVSRELQGGAEERVGIEVPAVLAIWNGINQPRYASIRERRQAMKTEIGEVSLDDMDVAEGEVGVDGAATRVEAYFEPSGGEMAELFEGSPDETAAELANQLDELGIVN